MNDDTFMRQKFYKSACWYMCWYEAKPNWDIFIYIRQLRSLFESSPRTNSKGSQTGALFRFRPDTTSLHRARVQKAMTILRSMIAALVLATGLFLAPVATYADNDATSKHPAIQQADAQREKEANRKRYLLVFPAAVIGITVALIIITRRRK